MMEGIVLRRINYQESSFILSILTKEGYKSLIVKGAKRKNSLKLGISEPLTLIDYISTRSLNMPSLIEGVVLDNYSSIKADLNKVSIASILLEYALILKETDMDPLFIYNLLIQSLDSIEKYDDSEKYLFRFELVLLNRLGVALDSEYLISNYDADDNLLDSLVGLMDDRLTIDYKRLRDFFIIYF